MSSIENTIIFTIARMNPPTPGHIYLLENMIEKALEEKVGKINIILSATVDTLKNPIECEEKRQIIYNYGIEIAKNNVEKKMPDKMDEIRNLNTEIICLNDEIEEKYGKSPVVAKFNYMLNNYYNYPRPGLKVLLVIGKDRENDYNFFNKMLNEMNPPVVFNKFVVPRPENAISATMIRGLATSNNPEDENTFLNYMNSIGMDKPEASSLMYQIRDNTQVSKKAKLKGGKRKIRSKNKKITKAKTKRINKSKTNKRKNKSKSKKNK